jgi:hypothetical protein
MRVLRDDQQGERMGPGIHHSDAKRPRTLNIKNGFLREVNLPSFSFLGRNSNRSIILIQGTFQREKTSPEVISLSKIPGQGNPNVPPLSILRDAKERTDGYPWDLPLNGSSPGPRGNTPQEEQDGSELARNHQIPRGGLSGSFEVSLTILGWLLRDPLGL